MAKIADGAPMDAMLRKVAAIKAFCHFLDIQIDPAMSFHELAQTHDNETANAELARFRDADNADPYPWLELALGKMGNLDPIKPQCSPKSFDFSLPLHRWRRNYITALKIAELELSEHSNLNRMLKLLSWMRDDFIFAGPAALLACIYFAPNSPPRKGLFKHLRSNDRLRAIKGVRNAAWDLTQLSDMTKRVNEANGKNIRILFASFDEGLRNLAKLLLTFTTDVFSEKLVVHSLLRYWNEDQAELIAKSLAELIAEVNSEKRKRHQKNFAFPIEEMIRLGEQQLIAADNVI